ncbi:siderophore-interacting protein [Nocardioides sp. CFH 31398]|uniref:siderophore-interacting protein n=1 Tax=Nocardioides sp. CFH 31398 TaxID=2919579 RepID=UPI001F050CC9|nr:siderophore-interacting protein [Nocardioides sp. CFH 31398]MCH1868448.1 siderophore-interacting protein [Nocardioides sp. CFH 31398]
MTRRAQQYDVQVLRRERLGEHLVRLHLGGPGLDGFASTGVPDEWVGLVVPGQFQHRYYTLRLVGPDALVVDVVVHAEGLVTQWAERDCTGETVTITEPKGSFSMPGGAGWLLLVADLTGLPAIARIAESRPAGLPCRVWVESADDLGDYLPSGDGLEVTWVRPPAGATSALADVVAAIDWPAGDGYFWMAGESAQMRAIRKHLRHDRGLPASSYDVMGYWRDQVRQRRAVDPGPIYAAGKAAGKTDEQIWDDYDRAREA